MQKSTETSKDQFLLKTDQKKELVGHKKANHKRSRSQPMQSEDPDKFEKMYNRHLQHYMKILVQGKQGQEVLGKTMDQGEMKGFGQNGQQGTEMGVGDSSGKIVRESKTEEEGNLMELLKGLGMEDDLLKEVMAQSKKVAKQW